MKIDSKKEKEQKLLEFLFNKYGAMVDVEVASSILKKSRATLYRDRKNGTGVNFIQDKDNGTIRYPIHEIASYIYETGKKNEA